MNWSIGKRAAFAAIALVLAGVALAQSVVDRAKGLMREGKAKEAYELLEPAADQLNDAESAYLLGIAALDTGKAGLAIIAFERSLGYDPNFSPARAEMIRALLAVGDVDQARVELARLGSLSVPPEVRQKLNELERQLAAANELASRKTRGITGYVEAEAGYDTNINTGANSATVAIPLFGGATATLGTVFLKKASTLAGLGTGITGFTEVQPGLRLFAGVDLKTRYNFEKLGNDRYETDYGSGNIGGRWQSGAHTVTGAVTYLEDKIGGQRLDRQQGGYGQWQYLLNASNEIGAFAQYLDQQHPIQRLLDTRLSLVGVGLRHGFEAKGSPVLSLATYFGDDDARGVDPAVGRKIYGGRVGYEQRMDFGARFFGSIAYQLSKYGGENIFFMRRREDKRTDFAIGLAYTPAKDWTITPQLLVTRNRSNIPVVDFSREQYLVTIRRDFY